MLELNLNNIFFCLFSKDYREAFRHNFGQWPLIGYLLGRNYEENSMGIQQMMMIRTIGDIHMSRLMFTTINRPNANLSNAAGDGQKIFQKTNLNE